MSHGLLTYLLGNDDDFRSFDALINLSLSERREQLWWEEVTSTSSCDCVQAYNQPSVEGWYGRCHNPIICCKGVYASDSMPSRISVVEREHGNMVWLGITNVRSKIMTMPMPYNIHDCTDNCCGKSDMSLSTMIEILVLSPETRSAKGIVHKTFCKENESLEL